MSETKCAFITVLVGLGALVLTYNRVLAIVVAIIAFGICSAFSENWQHRTSPRDRWKVYGGLFVILVFAFAFGAYAITTVTNEIAAMLVTFIGVVVGICSAKLLGWDADTLEVIFRNEKSNCEILLKTLVGAAKSDAEISDGERQEIQRHAQKLYAKIGFTNKIEIAQIFEELIVSEPIGENHFKYFVPHAVKSLGHSDFSMDICSVMVADGEINEKELEWLVRFLDYSEVSDRTFWRLFFRNREESEFRRNCLIRLGLSDGESVSRNTMVETI